ncbi:MAG TPA: hypothetical protein VJ932_04405, partial [Alkalispirochaeta sp.]|nr:hypothetical protein [Alkalispirochaeta sp.]
MSQPTVTKIRILNAPIIIEYRRGRKKTTINCEVMMIVSATPNIADDRRDVILKVKPDAVIATTTIHAPVSFLSRYEPIMRKDKTTFMTAKMVFPVIAL